MKYIFQGIKDWIKDCWHDWLLNRLQAAHPNATIYLYDHEYEADIIVYHWKEGNLWHYIQNRRIVNKRKNK